MLGIWTGHSFLHAAHEACVREAGPCAHSEKHIRGPCRVAPTPVAEFSTTARYCLAQISGLSGMTRRWMHTHVVVRVGML